MLLAGHVFGSAQIRVTRSDGHRVVYTGDVSLEPALTAEAAPVLSCETLVIESTFGHPKYCFPPRAQVYDDVAGFLFEADQVTEVAATYDYGGNHNNDFLSITLGAVRYT